MIALKRLEKDNDRESPEEKERDSGIIAVVSVGDTTYQVKHYSLRSERGGD